MNHKLSLKADFSSWLQKVKWGWLMCEKIQLTVAAVKDRIGEKEFRKPRGTEWALVDSQQDLSGLTT